MKRRQTRKIKIGSRWIGTGESIPVQSMLSVPWEDTEGNIKQAIALEKAGCDILRVAVPTRKSIELVKALKKAIDIPLVADIHFDWKLAILAVEAGIDKIRINPGNIGSKEKVKAVAEACMEKSIPIRIGVNSGSLEKHILEKYGTPTPGGLVESGIYHAEMLEEWGFSDIVLSMKSYNVPLMMEAYRLAAEKTTYPLHLGVTHTGAPAMGMIKSAIGIGGLLALGIGDTLRVSLTAPPEEEVKLGHDILKALGLEAGPEIISCPTCGRCDTDLVALTHEVGEALKGKDYPITVAVMGCIVNGPGEAREADIGLTNGGHGKMAIFVKGKVIGRVDRDKAMAALLKEIGILVATLK